MLHTLITSIHVYVFGVIACGMYSWEIISAVWNCANKPSIVLLLDTISVRSVKLCIVVIYLYWALPIHASFGNFDLISRSLRVGKGKTESCIVSVLMTLNWNLGWMLHIKKIVICNSVKEPKILVIVFTVCFVFIIIFKIIVMKESLDVIHNQWCDLVTSFWSNTYTDRKSV